MAAIPSVTPEQLAEELASADPPALLDVREAAELQIACLQNKYHIPLGWLPSRYEELGLDENLVVYCRSGARSAQATLFLLQVGFLHVRNLEDGILGYADRVDHSLTRY